MPGIKPGAAGPGSANAIHCAMPPPAKNTLKLKKLSSDLLVQIRRILRQKLRRVFRRNEVGNKFWKKENLAAEDFLDLTDNEFSFAEELRCKGHLG